MNHNVPAETSDYPAMMPVWFVIAGWIAVAMPVLYVLSRILWAVGIPLGIEEQRMEQIGLPGAGSITLVLLSLPALATALFTWWFIVTGRQAIPGSGGRRLSRGWVIGLILIPILILAYANAVNLVVMVTDLAPSDDMEALTPWSLWAHLTLFWAWFLGLVIATVTFWRKGASNERDLERGHRHRVE